jgi:hypothetical protein
MPESFRLLFILRDNKLLPKIARRSSTMPSVKIHPVSISGILCACGITRPSAAALSSSRNTTIALDGIIDGIINGIIDGIVTPSVIAQMPCIIG